MNCHIPGRTVKGNIVFEPSEKKTCRSKSTVQKRHFGIAHCCTLTLCLFSAMLFLCFMFHFIVSLIWVNYIDTTAWCCSSSIYNWRRTEAGTCALVTCLLIPWSESDAYTRTGPVRTLAVREIFCCTLLSLHPPWIKRREQTHSYLQKAESLCTFHWGLLSTNDGWVTTGIAATTFWPGPSSRRHLEGF